MRRFSFIHLTGLILNKKNTARIYMQVAAIRRKLRRDKGRNILIGIGMEKYFWFEDLRIWD
jgi:hypothetical protein